MSFPIFTYDTQAGFPKLIPNTVLAVAACEVNDEQVEKMFKLLTTWDTKQLMTHTSTRFLTWGWVRPDDDGIACHNRAHQPPAPILTNYTWAVMEVSVAEPNSEQKPQDGLRIYAAHNVGREGWCLLTANSHTLIHVLRLNNMYTTHLYVGRRCESDCKARQYYLVPKTRPSYIMGRKYLKYDFSFSQTDADVILEDSK